MAQPTTAPAAPDRAEANVLAMVCNKYTTNTIDYWEIGWGSSDSVMMIEEQEIRYYNNLGWCILSNKANTDDTSDDASAFSNLHVDMWAPAASKVKMTFESKNGDPKTGVEFVLAAGWNSFDAPLTDWEGVTFAGVKYLIFEAYTDMEGNSLEGTGENAKFAFANAYFFNNPAGVQNAAAIKAQKLVENGQIVILKNGVRYNVLGAQL